MKITLVLLTAVLTVYLRVHASEILFSEVEPGSQEARKYEIDVEMIKSIYKYNPTERMVVLSLPAKLLKNSLVVSLDIIRGDRTIATATLAPCDVAFNDGKHKTSRVRYIFTIDSDYMEKSWCELHFNEKFYKLTHYCPVKFEPITRSAP